MVTAITAYISQDGVVHREREQAEFADYNLTLRQDIRRFFTEEGLAPADGAVADILARWDLWKMGGYAGWVQSLAAPETSPALSLVAKPADARQQQLQLEMPAAAAAAPAQPVIVPAAPLPHEPRSPVNTTDEKERQFRRRVAVIALPNQHHRTIEKEFGDEFKLLLLDYANSMQKLESLRMYHKVIIMTRHAHPKTAAFLRSIGQEPMRVEGGIENLREALTGLYLATAA